MIDPSKAPAKPTTEQRLAELLKLLADWEMYARRNVAAGITGYPAALMDRTTQALYDQ